MTVNLDSDVFGFQAKKSTILLSEMRSLCPGARFAEKWKNLISFTGFCATLFWLVFFQEFSLRVRKVDLEELAGKKVHIKNSLESEQYTFHSCC